MDLEGDPLEGLFDPNEDISAIAAIPLLGSSWSSRPRRKPPEIIKLRPLNSRGRTPARPLKSPLAECMRSDRRPWYKKRNLRMLYLLLVPAALGVQVTSGYDFAMMSGVQAIDPWVKCIILE
jgi:hypothetical protein